MKSSMLLMMLRRHRALLAFVQVVMLVSFSVNLSAANVWDGGGADNNWGTVNNWDNNATPGYGTLTFSGTTRTTNSNNSISAMNQVNWAGTAAWTMTGSTTLSLFDNGGTQAKLEANTSGGVTINAPITFAANNGSPPNPFGEINAINSNISFTGSTLTVNGSSVNGIKFWGGSGRDVSFANTVSASGKYFATTGGGSISIASGGSVTTGDVYVMNGGALNLSGGSLTTSAVRLGGDFGTTGNQNQTLAATLALTPGSGGISFGGTVNAVSGNTSGSLLINSQNTSGTNTISGGVFLDSDLKVQQASGGTLALSGTVDVKNKILTFQGSGDIGSAAISNSIAGGRVNQNGTGVLTFSGANTYTGETDINAGTIRVSTAPSGAGLTSTYYVGNGGATGTAAALLLGPSGGLTFGNPVSANLGSGGNRVIGGSNTTGTNTYSGTVTLNDSNATLRAATGGTVAFNTISAAALQTVSIGGGGSDGTVQFGGISDNINVAATVNSGVLVLNKTSSSTVHSVGGTLAINSGATAQLGGTGGDQIFNSGSITVNSGGAFDANDRSETVTNISLAGTGIGSAGALVNNGSSASALTATGTTTLAADSSIGVTNSGGSLALSGSISGSFGLTKVGAGTLTLTGSNSYGTTTISGGTLQVGNGGSTGSLGSGAVTNNGALVFNRASGAPNNFVLANAISGSGTLTQNGANIITISSANTYTGATTINSGRIRVEANEALGTGAAGTTVNSGGALLLANVNYSTAEALTINGTGVSGSGALANVSGSSTYAGQITAASNATIKVAGDLTLTGGLVKNGTVLTINGTGSVIVNGTGISGASANSDLIVDTATLVVNAASNYNGPTTVQNGGTLVSKAQIDTTTVTVDSASTLSGTSKVVAASGGSVFLNGQFIVGDSTIGSPVASQFEIATSGAGSTVVGSTAVLKLDLFSGAGAGDNTTNTAAADIFKITGALSLNSGATLEIANPNSLAGWAWGDMWKIWNTTSMGTLTGVISTINAPTLGGGLVWDLNESTGILSIVPEPSRALLIMIGFLGLGLRRRRK